MKRAGYNTRSAVSTIVAAAVLLLLFHAAAAAVNECIGHARQSSDVDDPEMDAGVAVTVTGAVMKHPVVGNVYVMTGTPDDTPVTSPEPSTVASPELLLPQVPPPASLSEVIEPTHTFIVPEIAAGAALTVITVVALQLPPKE